jgi:hypothetical protein
MTEPSLELGVIEEGALPVPVDDMPPATLFHTDNPIEIVAKATEIAEVLARVLKEQHLTSSIHGREHVRVEGWTFCGTMLGVYPVCTWTRETQTGWEARVEARTRDGAVVGAAESSCSREESTWKNRDDFAIRSMAQTRAVSKALRLPLGFIVALAGFEVTPAEELGAESPASGTSHPFNAATDLLPGAPKDMKAVAQALAEIEPSVDWAPIIRQAVFSVYENEDWRDLPQAKQGEVGTRLANVVVRLTDTGGDFPPLTDEQIQKAFAEMFGGVVIQIPAAYVEPTASDEPKQPGGAYDEEH